MKIDVVNFANSNQWYSKGQDRLKECIPRLHPEIDLITFTDEDQIGAPRHADNPYAFKVYGIENVRARGYDVILWMDSSVHPVKNLQPVLDWIEKYGYFMEYGGHVCSRWCNDISLAFFGVTRDEAEKMEMFSACFLALDFTKQITKDFFGMWKGSCVTGCFKGKWNNDEKTESQDSRCSGHRHDQSCASIIMAKLGMKQSPCGNLMAYIGNGYGVPNDSVVIHVHPAI
jgi:hypothetical protein